MAAVTLVVVGNKLEAEALCGLLRTDGIHCFHRPTNLSVGMGDGLAIAGPTEVLVDEVDLATARKLLPGH